jgi:transcription antitermination protein NusB
MDLRSQPAREAIAAFYGSISSDEHEGPPPGTDPFMEQLVEGVVSRLPDIDRRIAEHSEHWRLERMPAVDRNILRLAVCELLREDTPPAVAIDEALELARRFSSEESVAFINGVLDAVRRELSSK